MDAVPAVSLMGAENPTLLVGDACAVSDEKKPCAQVEEAQQKAADERKRREHRCAVNLPGR